MGLLPCSVCLETVHPQGQAGRQAGELSLFILGLFFWLGAVLI